MREQEASPDERDEERAASSLLSRDGSSAGQEEAPGRQLVSKEDRQTGAVSWATVTSFARSAGGACMLWVCLALFWGAEGGKLGSDAWLAAWAEDSLARSDGFYAGVYGAFGVGVAVLLCFRGVVFVRTMLRASRRVHDEAFSAVLHAEMQFFETTPLGRILARFSIDIEKIDTLLVDVAEIVFSLLTRCLLSIALICALLPAFLLFVLPIGALYWRFLQYFRRVVRQMKRIDSIARSPLISQVQSVVLGLTSARAYDLVPGELARNLELLDATSSSYLGFYFTNRWIGFRLDLLTTVMVTAAATLIVVFASTISAGLAGLVLSSALQTSGVFQFGTRQAAELEAQFTSVERLRYFIEHTPKERQTVPLLVPAAGGAAEAGGAAAAGTEAAAQLTPDWPSRGEIRFEGYSVRYREGLPLVLTQLTLTAPGGKATALVGRTGSGKSTSIAALYRLVEAAAGRIVLDGVDIAGVPLARLRGQALSIIPQSPTLFAGSIRYNLDPFNAKTDEEVWKALKEVGMAAFVALLAVKSNDSLDQDQEQEQEQDQDQGQGQGQHLEQTQQEEKAPESFRFAAAPLAGPLAGPSGQERSGLDYVLEEGGLNLSAGQRQLLAFARALLKNAKVICIDEGTSNVDENSDQAIQRMLRETCRDKTLIVIAHRLATVRHLDLVCVLDHGKLIESGSPDALLADSNSAFAKMWAKSISVSRNRAN